MPPHILLVYILTLSSGACFVLYEDAKHKGNCTYDSELDEPNSTQKMDWKNWTSSTILLFGNLMLWRWSELFDTYL